jgi:hypothetical protein
MTDAPMIVDSKHYGPEDFTLIVVSGDRCFHFSILNNKIERVSILGHWRFPTRLRDAAIATVEEFLAAR